MSNFPNKNINYGLIEQASREFQIYAFLVIFLISVQLICNSIEPVILSFGNFKIPASALFYVFSFAISDIITENFGFKLAVRASILNAISQLVFCGIATIVILLPKEFASEKASDSFSYFFHFISLELVSSIVSLLISMITNDYLINKLKYHFLGQGFWWRTIASTIIGELIMLNIDYNVTFYGSRNFHEIEELIFNAMSYKIFAAFLLAAPATIISNMVGDKIKLLSPRIDQKTNIITEIKDAFIFN